MNLQLATVRLGVLLTAEALRQAGTCSDTPLPEEARSQTERPPRFLFQAGPLLSKPPGLLLPREEPSLWV